MKDNVFTICRLVDKFSDKFRNLYNDYNEFIDLNNEIGLDIEELRRMITHPFFIHESDKDFVSEIKKLVDDFIISFENMKFPSSKINSEFYILRHCFSGLYGELEFENRLIDDLDELKTNEMQEHISAIQRFVDEFEFHFEYLRSKCEMVIEVINMVNLNFRELGKQICLYYKNCFMNAGKIDYELNDFLKLILRLVDKNLNKFEHLLNNYNKIIAKMDVINLDIGVLKTTLEDDVEDNLHSPTILDINGKYNISI